MASEVKKETRVEFFDRMVALHNEARKLKAEEAELRKVRKQLMKFDMKMMDRISKKKNFGKLVEHKIDEFMPLLHRFMELYTVIFESLNHMVVQDEGEEFKDMKKVAHFLQEIATSRHLFVFTPKQVAEFRREFEAFVHSLKSYVARDYKDAKRIGHHKMPKMGLWRKMASDVRLSRSIRKTTKKLKKEDHNVEELSNQIAEQLRSGIRPDFLVLFMKYLKTEGEFEATLENMRASLRALIAKHIVEHNEVVRTINPFIQWVAAHPGVGKHDIKKIIEMAKHLYETVLTEPLKYMKMERKDQKTLYAGLMYENRMGHEILAKLEEGQKKISEAGKESPGRLAA